MSISRSLRVRLVRSQLKEVGKGMTLGPHFVVRGGRYITIGDDFHSGRDTTIGAWDRYQGETFHPRIVIGRGVRINAGAYISAINSITIGNDVLFGRNVLIVDNNHGRGCVEEIDIPPAQRKLYSRGPVVIEDNVWLGEGVAVMPGVRIGYSAIIGAHSVVTGDIPARCVAVGSPARVIKHL